MKKVIVDFDSSTDNFYYNGIFIGSVPPGTEVEEAKTRDKDVLVKLVTSGMSAEDLIKLKHGGVL